MVKQVFRAVRILFALGLFAGLFYFVGAYEVLKVFLAINWYYIIILLLITPVMIWASCLKWRLFIEAGGNKVPILHLMKLYTMGFFFSVLTPSTIGGDIARSYHLGRYLSSQRDAFVATFLERFTGVLAMVALAVCALLVGADVARGVSGAVYLVGLVCLIAAFACFYKPLGEFCFRIMRKLVSIVKLKAADKLLTLLDKVEEGMSFAHNNLRLFWKAMLLSFFFHFLTVLNTYLCAVAIGWTAPDIAGLFVVVPLVLLVGAVPLTPSNLGITEGAFLFFLQRVGATQSQGLSVALLIRAKVILIALAGGLIWLEIRKKRAKEGR